MRCADVAAVLYLHFPSLRFYFTCCRRRAGPASRSTAALFRNTPLRHHAHTTRRTTFTMHMYARTERFGIKITFLRGFSFSFLREYSCAILLLRLHLLALREEELTLVHQIIGLSSCTAYLISGRSIRTGRHLLRSR
ncbi:hypothetical protein CGRA01v4_02331 [Colletotrichum graminicola]|nr:hypothetical protein CGRA01v4_02331 [Colletotrichum graminicola]